MAKDKKPGVHNEWFQQISKRSCPCGQKKTDVFAWGEYLRGNWRTVEHFCEACYSSRVEPRLRNHASECGCTFAFQARSGYSLPAWLRAKGERLAKVCAIKRDSKLRFQNDL
jgi:hypothetical protein